MSTEQVTFVASTHGERLDKVILAHIGDRLSRSQLQTLIADGLVTVDGQNLKAGVKLKGGEEIHLTIPVREAPETVKPEQIPLAIVYEDDDLAVIDKAAGMIVHPGEQNETGTLVSAALARWPQIADHEY